MSSGAVLVLPPRDELHKPFVTGAKAEGSVTGWLCLLQALHKARVCVAL